MQATALNFEILFIPNFFSVRKRLRVIINGSKICFKVDILLLNYLSVDLLIA